jgi:hypothetical protein
LSDDAAACTATAAATDNNEDVLDDVDDDSDDEDDEDEKLPGTQPAIMSNKGLKKSPLAATAAKRGGGVTVEEITAGMKKNAIVSSPKKGPAFTPYTTKVTDPALIRCFLEGGERFVEVDLTLAAAVMCGDGIKAILTPDGMGISFQRGVYVNFFTNRRLRKDLGDTYSKDSSRVTAHRKVYDEFKKKERDRIQNGIVYGEFQVVQLPCQCTGLVEQTYIGYVPTPITCPFTSVDDEDGMVVEQDHVQFIVNTTFRVKTVDQLEKEKKAARAVTQNYNITDDIDSEDDL